MSQFFQNFVLTFIPLFVAIDPLGILPLILPLTEETRPSEWPRIVNIALITASALGLAFLGVGKGILWVLDISVAHFAIAGGIILLALSIKDLVIGKLMESPLKKEMVAVVPIGTPLVIGPAALTTLLLLVDEYHYGFVIGSLVLNLLLTWIIFLQANRIARLLGQGGLRAISKVASLLLAAIGVKMIFKGIGVLYP
jgi:multiple antibiotic resistance protein